MSDDTDNKKLVAAAEPMTVGTMMKAADLVVEKDYLARKRILDEDSFNDAVGEIIERDFFPHHKKMRMQKEYLEASKSGDKAKMHRLINEFMIDTPIRHAGGSATPRFTPDSFKANQTPDLRDRNSAAEENKPEDDDKTIFFKPDTSQMTLNQFFSKYACEDDASFEVIMAKEKRSNREKNSWLYDTENKAVEAQQLQLKENGEQGPKDTNMLAYTAKNALMFYPDSNASVHSKEMLLKIASTKKVVHENTRLHYDPFKKPESITRNKDKMSFEELERKRLNPHGIVDTDGIVQAPDIRSILDPSPAPNAIASPVMTWGSIEDTPLRLDTDIDISTGPSFYMPEVSAREKAGQKLQENAVKSRLKEQAKKSHLLRKALTPRSGSKTPFGSALSGMSPAAQRLMKNTVKSTDPALRASYTPNRARSKTPRTTENATPINKTPSRSKKATPARKPSSSSSSSTSTSTSVPSSSITDDLLNI